MMAIAIASEQTMKERKAKQERNYVFVSTFALNGPYRPAAMPCHAMAVPFSKNGFQQKTETWWNNRQRKSERKGKKVIFRVAYVNTRKKIFLCNDVRNT